MLYYIHGYLSEPNSTKGILFKDKLNAKPIKYRDCKPENLIISDCLERIKKEIKNDENVVLIGSSLGGFLAAKTAQHNSNVKKIILLNPAIIPPSYDITKIQDIPQSILRDMQDKSLFDEKIKSKIFIIRGSEDDLVPDFWILEFAKAQEATIMLLNDDHSLTKNIQKLPDIIRNIIDQKH